MTTDNNSKIKGLGVTREQLKNYLKARIEQGDMRPLIVKEMYTREDEDYTLVTENTPRMVVTKLRMHLMQAAIDTKREKSLIQVFLEKYNLEMIALNRKGRLELLGGLQMLAAEEEGGGDRPVSLGGRGGV